MHWHGNGNGLGQGEVERVQLEDERARISMRLRMLVLSVAQEARQARARQGKARRGGKWHAARPSAGNGKRKGKPCRLRRADWVGYCDCCCARGWGPKNCATPAMQGKVNYGSYCCCCCRCCCCLCCCCHCCACCAVAPKSEIKIK